MYLGEFACDSHFFKRDADRDGNERDVIVFRLMPVSNTLRRELDDLPDQDDNSATKAESQLGDLSTLRQAAIAACQPGGPIADAKETVRIAYQRSARVKRYVLARAQGHCELCDAPAPFNRKSDGTPYLEPHHINRLDVVRIQVERTSAALALSQFCEFEAAGIPVARLRNDEIGPIRANELHLLCEDVWRGIPECRGKANQCFGCMPTRHRHQAVADVGGVICHPAAFRLVVDHSGHLGRVTVGRLRVDIGPEIRLKVDQHRGIEVVNAVIHRPHLRPVVIHERCIVDATQIAVAPLLHLIEREHRGRAIADGGLRPIGEERAVRAVPRIPSAWSSAYEVPAIRAMSSALARGIRSASWSVIRLCRSIAGVPV